MADSVPWIDVLPIANEAFRLWTGAPEQRWASEAWTHLTRAGLAANGDPLVRARTYIRFLVLASFYRDWCSVAWCEHEDDDFSSWLEPVEVNPIHIGQLLGPDVVISPDAEEGREEALRILVDREHAAVIATLMIGFGHVEGLFVALWRSRCEPDDATRFDEDEEDEPSLETDAEILNDVTDEKLAAYAWMRGGCESRGPDRTSSSY
jgi:hypothetical protein